MKRSLSQQPTLTFHCGSTLPAGWDWTTHQLIHRLSYNDVWLQPSSGGNRVHWVLTIMGLFHHTVMRQMVWYDHRFWVNVGLWACRGSGALTCWYLPWRSAGCPPLRGLVGMQPAWVGFYCTAILYQRRTFIFSSLYKHVCVTKLKEREAWKVTPYCRRHAANRSKAMFLPAVLCLMGWRF